MAGVRHFQIVYAWVTQPVAEFNRDLRGEKPTFGVFADTRILKWLIETMASLHLSTRSTHSRLKVTRTLAELSGEYLDKEHLNTAVVLREAPSDTDAMQA